jgi:WD40 repeat protein
MHYHYYTRLMRIADVSSHQDFEVKPITQPNLHASFIHLIESDKDGFSCVALDEECLAVARINAKINIYSITNSGNAKLMLTILGHSSPVYAMLIHDKLLFTGESIEDALIKIWELRTGTLVRALKGHTYPIMSISAFSR